MAYVGLNQNLKDLKEPGNSDAAYRVSHHRSLGYGERRCGFNTKHQSTYTKKVSEGLFWVVRETQPLNRIIVRVAYLVMQNKNLEYGERRCGFDPKHQSTKVLCTKISTFVSVNSAPSRHCI